MKRNLKEQIEFAKNVIKMALEEEPTMRIEINIDNLEPQELINAAIENGVKAHPPKSYEVGGYYIASIYAPDETSKIILFSKSIK